MEKLSRNGPHTFSIKIILGTFVSETIFLNFISLGGFVPYPIYEKLLSTLSILIKYIVV